MITGKATREGTERIVEANPELRYSPFGSFDVWISQVGYGTYRIEETDEQHHQSMKKAVREGINLIDTSSMYTNGSSEKIVGKVVNQLIADGQVKREELVIVSKVGIIQGEDWEATTQRSAEGQPYPDLTIVQEGMALCIHPAYIQDQLTRSLERLQLSTVDAYLLHNPEWYLLWAKSNKIKQEEAYATFIERIERAFRHLETEVEQGRIQCYGISANSFPYHSSQADFIPVDQLWEIAERISPNHHFRILQFPMNMCEPGGVLEKSHGQGQSVLAFAKEKQLGVMTNRPFDVTMKEKIFRLVETRWDDSNSVDEKTAARQVKDSLEQVEEVEDQIIYEILPSMGLQPDQLKELKHKVSSGALLRKYWKKLYSTVNVQNIYEAAFTPGIESMTKSLETYGRLDGQSQKWLTQYRDALDNAERALRAYYAPKDYQRMVGIKQQLTKIAPTLTATDTLSQTAIRILRSTPEVHCSLVGMRRDKYVDDVLTELRRPLEGYMAEQEWNEVTNALKAVIV